MKFYDTIEEAEKHPEEGKRVFIASLNGTTKYTWNRSPCSSNVANGFLKFLGGYVHLATPNRHGNSSISSLPKAAALAELDRLRKIIEARLE